MRRLAVSILVLLAFGGLAAARGVHVVKKSRKEPVRMYWAQYLTQTELQVYPFPHGAKVGDQFDVADNRGYLGRVQVSRVEQQQAACNVVYFIATARFQETPSRQPEGTLIVFTPQPRAPGRARILPPEEARDVPGEMAAQGRYPEVVLDWDGDRDPDLLRYYYDCPAPKGNVNAYCMDTFQRVRGGWGLIEHYPIVDCY